MRKYVDQCALRPVARVAKTVMPSVQSYPMLYGQRK